jgi:hypothetical protein
VARCMHSPASANKYMVLIVLLVFVCVRTSEQMGKLINGGSKISLFTLTFFYPAFFFVLRMFVPIMLLSTRRQSHGLTSDRASMCTHIHIQWRLYWKWLFMIDCQPARRTTRRQRKRKEQMRGGEEILTKVRNTGKYTYIWYCSNFSINSADTKSFFLSVLRYTQLITERSDYDT